MTELQERQAAAPAAQPAEPAPRPPKRRRLFFVVLALAFLLAAAVSAYVNAKLDLIAYHDGSVQSAGSIDAGEDQDLSAEGLAINEEEMVMPAASPFVDRDVVNILLIGTDERTDEVNDWDAFTHLDRLDGTRATAGFSENARADALILVSLNIRNNTIRLVSIERGTGVPV